jgi:dTDP-4-dehydrorhamnose 3,5-epimerase
LQVVPTSLPGVLELRPRVIRDARGFFLETYHRSRLAELGIRDNFVQDNQSLSSKGTLRGLHYQLRRAQAKLCRVVEGEVFDVAVDIRRSSPNFGKWTGLRLCAQDQNQIYIPAGFAHGFFVLSETAQFLYKCSDFYDSTDEHGIAWNDPALGIAWGAADPVMSPKDAKLPNLADVAPQLLPG